MTPIVRNADQKTVSMISSEVLSLFEHLKMFTSLISSSLSLNFTIYDMVNLWRHAHKLL